MITLLELKELLPTWYTGLLEFETLMQIEQHLLDDLVASIERAQGNLYVSTADSETIAIYERMLRITRQADDTLDMRRFRVLTRLSSQKPYTIRYLTEMLNSIGTDVTVTCLYDEYTLLINSTFERRGQMTDVDYLLRAIVPANMQLKVKNALMVKALKQSAITAAACVATHFVTLTQDFNQRISSKQMQRVATSQVTSELYQVTQDFQSTQNIQNDLRVSTGQTDVSFETLTQDVKGDIAVKASQVQRLGNVSAEFISLGGEINGV